MNMEKKLTNLVFELCNVRVQKYLLMSNKHNTITIQLGEHLDN